MSHARAQHRHGRFGQAAAIAFIGAVQAGLIVTIVVWSLHLPQSTRSGVIVVLALVIWAEALWVLFRIAARVDRRLAESCPPSEQRSESADAGPSHPPVKRSSDTGGSRHEQRPLPGHPPNGEGRPLS